MKPNKKSFASDNNSGVHPEILRAIEDANQGHTIAYGDDPYTERAKEKLSECFGESIDAYFVFGGTGANVVGLQQILLPYQSVICPEGAHIHNDECGAPERFAGCKLLTAPSPDGKLTVDGIKAHMHGIDFEHHAQPRVVSISQATELGTVYTVDEIKAIADYAHENGLLLHVDGARLCNAAAYLSASLREITADVGVDVLSFGGAKNGLLVGECAIFFDGGLSRDFKYIRKQGMQLMSKMRFVGAQYEAYLTGDLCLKTARHANEMAKLLAQELCGVPNVRITQKVETNAVFAEIPKDCIAELQQEFFFYVWDEAASEVRWMTSFDTTEEDVKAFAQCIRAVVERAG